MSLRLEHSVMAAAANARGMLDAGEALANVWRHCIIQLLDDYESARRCEGDEDAASLLAQAPDRTGDDRVDAAFAALAEHLARRDGFQVPRWATEPDRTTGIWWFVVTLPGLHPRALVESPLSFRKRGVFITSAALERV